jgi:hypothetical protein
MTLFEATSGDKQRPFTTALERFFAANAMRRP